MKSVWRGLAGLCLTAAVAVAGDTLQELTTNAPARYAGQQPAFTAVKESFLFKQDNKEQSFWCIKDRGKYVGVLKEDMAQLDMIAFAPDRAADKPAFRDYYSWGTLLGTRILVNAWVGGMSPSGPVSYTFSGGGETLTLKTEQTWPDRKGACRYEMILRLDPVAGYVWDMRTDYFTDKPVTRMVRMDSGERAEFETTEFLNWQVPVTGWTRRNNNPRWPAAWTHERTIFQRTDGKFVGFYLNPEAVDRSRFKRTEVKEGGFVAMGPDGQGWGVALCHVQKNGFSANNATCNMWADSHNYLKFKAQPEADGFYRVTGTWRFQAVPPEVMKTILNNVEMDNMGR